jgi:acetolactate synthase-1/2/3 large subunit
VYVGIPNDLLAQPAEPLAVRPPSRPAPSEDELRAALELIEAAERIVLWVGGGAVQADAGEQVTHLAAQLCAPILGSWAGRGAVAPECPWLVDLPPHEPEITELVAQSDLVIAIGTAFDGPSTMNWKLPLPERLIAINTDPVDAGKNFPATPIVADARDTVQALTDRGAQRRGDAAWVADVCRRVKQRIAGHPDTAAAWQFVTALDGVIAGSDPIVVNDMAIPGYWAAGYARVPQPRRMQYPVGWGTLGYALPAAVGAAALGERPVLAVCGDGGLMFAVAELAVLRQHDLPVTVLVVDDGGYGMLRFDQTLTGAPHRGVDLVRPDFSMLARSFGIECRTTELAGLEQTLAESLAAGVPRMVLLEHSLYPPISVSARWPR